MAHALIDLTYEWITVVHDDETPYRFPLPIKRSGPYAIPAVYRWLPFQQQPGDFRRAYIGESENLARRVCGYLKPGPSQKTNIRMRQLMDGLVSDGLHVQLDVLRIDQLVIEDEPMPPNALVDRELRRLVENWMVWQHRRAGFEVLNA